MKKARGEPAELGEQGAGVGAFEAGDGPDQINGGIDKGGALTEAALEPGERREQEQEEEKVWMREGHERILKRGK